MRGVRCGFAFVRDDGLTSFVKKRGIIPPAVRSVSRQLKEVSSVLHNSAVTSVLIGE
jgi:hypothetical protein